MLKPTQSLRHALPAVLAALVLGLSACGAQGEVPTPTMNVTAIYTEAFQTITAQQATAGALNPVGTPTPLLPVPQTGGSTSATPSASSGIPNTGGGTASAGTGQSCDNAIYVSDITIPDGTSMAPGQSFGKTWAVTNTGTCTWGAGYKLVFLSGESMGGTSVPMAGAVGAGQSAQLSVNLTAPVLPGNYTGTWRMQNAAGTYFGDTLTVVISVSNTGGSGVPQLVTSTP